MDYLYSAPLANLDIDGNRHIAVPSLNILESLDSDKINALNQMGVHTIADLLNHQPLYRARLVTAYADGEVAHGIDLTLYIQDGYSDHDIRELPDLETIVLDGIGSPHAEIWEDAFNIKTIRELGEFPPYREAAQYMRAQYAAFTEPSSAPDDLIPKTAGAVSTKARYSSFVRDITINNSNLKLELGSDDSDIANGIVAGRLLCDDNCFIQLGYVVNYAQEWTNQGVKLGELVHSLPLAPGESRNIAIIDWRRKLLFSRNEKTDAVEQLDHFLFHKRSLDEVVRAVALEHQTGRTFIEADSDASASSLVANLSAVGSVVGGVSGGITGTATGALTGLALDSLTAGTDVGAGTIGLGIAGGIAGTAVGTVAGGFAGSLAGNLIQSSIGTLGTITTDSTGDRRIISNMSQNIADRTVQKSSNIRSLVSNIVIESGTEESETIRSANITNYNHSHALTIQYYEVLQQYRVKMEPVSIEPLLLLPIRPIDFNLVNTTALWPYIRQIIKSAQTNAAEQFDLNTYDGYFGSHGTFTPPEGFDVTSARVSGISLDLSRDAINITFPNVQIIHKANDGSEQQHPLIRDTSSYRFVNFEHIDTYNSTIAPAPTNLFDLDDITGIVFNSLGLASWVPNNFDATVTVSLLDPGSGKEASFSFTRSNISITALDSQVRKDFDLVQIAQQKFSEAKELEDKLQSLLVFLKNKTYLFTRQILQMLEPERLMHVIRDMKFVEGSNEDKLIDIISEYPLGVVGDQIIFKMKHMANLNTDTLRNTLTSYASDLNGSLDKQRNNASNVNTIMLPTAGMFAEAVLGRSNSSELIDLTRFWNWQDSPIPHQAPAIGTLQAGQHTVEPLPDEDPTVPGTTVNITPPVALPHPQSFAGVLNALNNGNLFRDMSKAEQLANVANNLANVAQSLAQSSGQLSGQAAQEGLQAAENIAGQAATLANTLASSTTPDVPPINITHEGGKINEKKKENKGPDPKKKETETEEPEPEPELSSAEVFNLIEDGIREVTFGYNRQDIESEFGQGLSEIELDQSIHSTTTVGKIRVGKILSSGFANNSISLGDKQKNALKLVAILLNSHPNARVMVIGHADRTGSEHLNQDLSLQRAQKVNDFLSANGVIDSKRYDTAIGAGTLWNPVASAPGVANATNRSVTILYSFPVAASLPKPVEIPAPTTTAQPTREWTIRMAGAVSGGAEAPVMDNGIGGTTALLMLRRQDRPSDDEIPFLYVAGSWAKILAESPDTSDFISTIGGLTGPAGILMAAIYNNLWATLQVGGSPLKEFDTSTPVTIKDFHSRAAFMTMQQENEGERES